MLKALILGAALTLSATAWAAPPHTPTPLYLPPSDLTQTPVKPVPVEIPVGKCSTDVTLFDTLSDNGYKVLLQFKDMSKSEVVHTLFYSSVDNRFVLGHTVSVSANPDQISKVCIEYIGNDPKMEGATFRELVLATHTLDKQNAIDAYETKKKEHKEKENEPYNGDPNKS